MLRVSADAREYSSCTFRNDAHLDCFFVQVTSLIPSALHRQSQKFSIGVPNELLPFSCGLSLRVYDDHSSGCHPFLRHCYYVEMLLKVSVAQMIA